ncbi:MAG: hypothetical protein A3D87_05115 [Omnitrophica WOR_2 bacterium RIFCSPHIGHO2_02_FULL_50_17]|nr:MAG: hypothetical protein A3D87_05115 [Omnitrophica WOR_2 bacterium RIFCSPHIGHO2_02_FULL_50_17]
MFYYIRENFDFKLNFRRKIDISKTRGRRRLSCRVDGVFRRHGFFDRLFDVSPRHPFGEMA